jgi:AcrR family transcriptional regulator
MTKTKRVLPARGPGRPAGSDKSGAHTREHLLETARSLLAEKGLGQLSLREIADRAQVNPALLHYYFGSKDELRSALQESSFKQLAERLASINSEGKPEARLEGFVRTLVEALLADHSLHRLVLQHALGSEATERARFDEDFMAPIHGLLSKIMTDGAKAGDFVVMDHDLTVSSVLGIVTMTVLFELRAGKSRNKVVTDHCVTLISQALAK